MRTTTPFDKATYNHRYYRRHKDAIQVRNLQAQIARGESLPPGQYLAHCGVWQKIDGRPHTCPTCAQRFFEPEP